MRSSFPGLVRAAELKDKSWHHLSAMCEYNADTASLFADGAIKVLGQGKFIQSSISWDGVFHVAAFSICILTSLRLCKGAKTEGELKLDY